MIKQIFIAGTFLLMNAASAHSDVPPTVAAPPAGSGKHQHIKTGGGGHEVFNAGSAHAPAVGIPGKSADVARTVAVDMTDAMRFFPASVHVRRGETVRFVVKNSGKLKHEMVLGSMIELRKHAEMMRTMPGMAHAEENMVFVEPGKIGELIWKFGATGKIDFACLQPGHFEAGMKGKFTVK